MPGIVRKLLVFAAVDGLVLQPLAQRNQRPAPTLKIDYRSHAVGPVLKDVQFDAQKNEGLEVGGIIGLLRVADSAFLVSISKRQRVAQICGKPIYVVTGVSVIPIESQKKAQAAIDGAKIEIAELREGEEDLDVLAFDIPLEPDIDSLMSSDEESQSASTSTDPVKPGIKDTSRKNSIAEDVISKKGVYGRFADRWFSKAGWTTGQRRNQGMSSDHDLAYPEPSPTDTKPHEDRVLGSSNGTAGDSDLDAFQRWPQTPLTEKTIEEASLGLQGNALASSLLPKLMNTTKLLFAAKTFFFSYDYDITHSLATQRQAPSDLPLFKDSDPEYFWNAHLSAPFIDKGFNEYVLPIMQGFVGQREFALAAGDTPAPNSQTLPEPAETPAKVVEAAVHDADSPKETQLLEHADEDKVQRFLLTLISRRSVYRSGLRYLRRGVDEDGHTANAVETEQLLSYPSWDSESKIQSFLQTRGSIPLFFSQIPYNFKPPPTLHASSEANLTALAKHFSNLVNRYGDLQAISLVDKHGTETQIGKAYEESVKTLNASGGVGGKIIGFDWFEFHKACRGMKFENVSILVENMSSLLKDNSWSVLQSSKLQQSQTGIIRTNCMDCLDRTNVVQSAFAQSILELQLACLGFSVNLTSDPSTTWFNTLWADNGDAISRAYTGTSALKGDYTRTRKRNMVGALTDLSLTLSRYYYNLFDDFFSQAAIDYLLGTVTADVFAEFEATMTSADPAIDLRKARQAAIATASNVVVEEFEDLLHGWALKTPALPNTLRTFPFTEILLLLTDKALYKVHFDWNASKVRSFERIDLDSIHAVQYGTYITETHAPTQTDPNQNVGFVIRYRPFLHESDGAKQDGNGDGRADANSQEDKSVQEALDPNADPTARLKPRPAIIRVNTGTLENVRDAWSITGADGRQEGFPEIDAGYDIDAWRRNSVPLDVQLLAFKVLPLRSTVVKQQDDMAKSASERESVRAICAAIAEAVNKARQLMSSPVSGQESASLSGDAKVQAGATQAESGTSDGRAIPGSLIAVENKDVIGINEAKASTGYLERVGWGIKKAIWG